MTVLVANIGTSDLAFKCGEYYLPLGFDRDEPNSDFSNLTKEEQQIWNVRQTFLVDILSPKLNIKANDRGQVSFRELTEKLGNLYLANDTEKANIYFIPSRILGVIDTAVKDFAIDKAYIFVTDQDCKHHQDSVYLFPILQKWFSNRHPELTLVEKKIPEDIQLNKIDRLSQYYRKFFNELVSETGTQETILISSKGGTPQMQNTLKFEALGSAFPKQLLIDPILSIKKVLLGEPSDCQLDSYWQYWRNQKYQTAKQLLERWDFDGAINILKSWRDILRFLKSKKVVDSDRINENLQQVRVIIEGLKVASSLFNLDTENAAKVIKKLEQDGFKLYAQELAQIIDLDNYDSILNLYTQCFVYQELNQIGNYLTNIASFSDVFLDNAIAFLEKELKITNNQKVNTRLLEETIGLELYGEFVRKEPRNNLPNKYTIHNRNSKKNYLRIFLDWRIDNCNWDYRLRQSWKEEVFTLSNCNEFRGIKGLISSLDFWIKQRNNLIHSAEGISAQRIQSLNKQRKKAAPYEKIPEILYLLLKCSLSKINHQNCDSLLGSVGKNERGNIQFLKPQDYYLYTDLRNWAIAQLKND